MYMVTKNVFFSVVSFSNCLGLATLVLNAHLTRFHTLSIRTPVVFISLLITSNIFFSGLAFLLLPSIFIYITTFTTPDPYLLETYPNNLNILSHILTSIKTTPTPVVKIILSSALQKKKKKLVTTFWMRPI